MPFINVDALSDDDEGANLKKGQVSPSGKRIPEKTPETVAVAAAAAVKSKAKPKKAASKAKAKSAAKTKATPPSDAEPVKEKLVAKRPAAKVDAPSESGKQSIVKKRPASADKTVVKAYKYLYHKENKWGIKLNKKEMMTVWVSKRDQFLVTLKLCSNMKGCSKPE